MHDRKVVAGRSSLSLSGKRGLCKCTKSTSKVKRVRVSEMLQKCSVPQIAANKNANSNFECLMLHGSFSRSRCTLGSRDHGAKQRPANWSLCVLWGRFFHGPKTVKTSERRCACR